MADFDAVVLCGGTSRRMGRGAKTKAIVGGQSLLDRAVGAVNGAVRIIAVGPECATKLPVTWVQEDPPGGGPVAGLKAGVGELELDSRRPVVILAGDLPFAGSAIPRLLVALQGHDVALLADPEGNDQYLIAAWQASRLRSQLAIVEPGNAENRSSRSAVTTRAGPSMRQLLAGVNIIRIAAQDHEYLDCDSPADLSLARQIVGDQ